MSAPLPPLRLDTPRLVLRAWHPDDAPAVDAAVRTSLEELRRWLPWARAEPLAEPERRELLARFRREFEAGEDFAFGVFDRRESEVLGGAGLHRRVGPGALELGYWMRSDRVGRGFATEAGAALLELAFARLGVARVQLRCDPANLASRRIAQKLGFAHVETLRDDDDPLTQPRDTLVFERTREEHAAG